MKKSNSKAARAKRLKAFKSRMRCFLASVRLNNPAKPGWNRAEDLGVSPEHQPQGKLMRWSVGFRDGQDSGRREVKPVVTWRY